MNLYQIEQRKLRLSTYLWAAFWIFVSLAALGVLCLFLGKITPEETALFTNWNGLLALSTAMDYACFSIFAAVLSAKLIVEEYCGNRALLLCAYPVSRRRILHTKCQLLIGFTTGLTFFCNLAVTGMLYRTAEVFGIVPKAGGGIVTLLLSSLFAGILSSAVGVISAMVGWKKRSVPATILSALVLVCFVPNLIAGFQDQMVWVLLVLCLLFSAVANGAFAWMVKGIERMEV